VAHLARAELAVELLALGVGGLAGDERQLEAPAMARSWVRYWPMMSTRLSR
jgi:hypothetical protein